MRNSIVFDVLIASPSDVGEERDLIESVIYEWNAANSKNQGIVLNPIRWEKNSFSIMGDHPQTLLNNQIVDEADIIIGVFWTKLGTPTERYNSGSEEELMSSIALGKPVSIYFSKKKIDLDSFSNDEYTRLREFKEIVSKKGLYRDFSSPEELRKLVLHGLQGKVSQIVKSQVIESEDNLPRVEMRNLMKHKHLWGKAFDFHKGGYIVYNLLQKDPNSSHKTNEQFVAASFLKIDSLSERGMEFEWINPHKLSHEDKWREFRYNGVAMPSTDKFLYLFADQVDGDYEVISSIIEFSPIKPASMLTGQLLAVSVNTDISVFRIGASGILLVRVDSHPEDLTEWYGKKLGYLPFEDLPLRMKERIPKCYSR
ncbi:hypothetical protein AAIA71_28685 (plasmid) [Vibrio harveyi]|uniref:hypothetical protein n=1 Tax=Vibrio harveyi TaxID=669 RepID=UPI0031BB627F